MAEFLYGPVLLYSSKMNVKIMEILNPFVELWIKMSNVEVSNVDEMSRLIVHLFRCRDSLKKMCENPSIS